MAARMIHSHHGVVDDRPVVAVPGAADVGAADDGAVDAAAVVVITRPAADDAGAPADDAGLCAVEAAEAEEAVSWRATTLKSARPTRRDCSPSNRIEYRRTGKSSGTLQLIRNRPPASAVACGRATGGLATMDTEAGSPGWNPVNTTTSSSPCRTCLSSTLCAGTVVGTGIVLLALEAEEDEAELAALVVALEVEAVDGGEDVVLELAVLETDVLVDVLVDPEALDGAEALELVVKELDAELAEADVGALKAIGTAISLPPDFWASRTTTEHLPAMQSAA